MRTLARRNKLSVDEQLVKANLRRVFFQSNDIAPLRVQLVQTLAQKKVTSVVSAFSTELCTRVLKSSRDVNVDVACKMLWATKNFTTETQRQENTSNIKKKRFVTQGRGEPNECETGASITADKFEPLTVYSVALCLCGEGLHTRRIQKLEGHT